MNASYAIPLSSQVRPNRARRVPRCPSGFSLLEILLAAAILAASSMVLFSTFSLGNRQGTQAVGEQHAMWLCQSLVEELLARPDKLQPAEGVAFPGDPEWSYSIQLAPTNIDGLVAVTVRVAKGASAGPTSLASDRGQSTAPAPVATSPAVNSTSQQPRGSAGGPPAAARSRSECTIVRWMRAAPANAQTSSASNTPDVAAPISLPAGGEVRP